MTNSQRALMLVWKHPVTRERYLIGHLWFDGICFRFRYETELPRSLVAALEAGFRALEPFPETASTYHDDRLFPVFRRRVPRHIEGSSVLHEAMSSESSPELVAFELLRLTGGRMPTDTLEFLEPAQEAEEGFEFHFPVAGWRHYGGEGVVQELNIGTEVPLGLEPENTWDRFAVKILSPSGVHIGYVPSIFSWYLAEFVEQDLVKAVVESIGPSSDPQQRVALGVRVILTEPPGQYAYKLVPSRIQEYAEPILA